MALSVLQEGSFLLASYFWRCGCLQNDVLDIPGTWWVVYGVLESFRVEKSCKYQLQPLSHHCCWFGQDLQLYLQIDSSLQ